MKTLWAVACAVAAAFLIGTLGGCASSKSRMADFSEMNVGEGPGATLRRLTELQKTPEDSPNVDQNTTAAAPPAPDLAKPKETDRPTSGNLKPSTEVARKKTKKERATKAQKAKSRSGSSETASSKATVVSKAPPAKPTEPSKKEAPAVQPPEPSKNEDSPSGYLSRFDDIVKTKTTDRSTASAAVATTATIPVASPPKPEAIPAPSSPKTVPPPESTGSPEGSSPRQAVAGPPQTPSAPPPATAGNTTAEAQYRIGREDVLSISVWGDKELTMDVVVRPDGKISFPLIQDIEAEGRTAAELAEQIRDKLLHYIKDPNVSVIVKQINAPKYSVIGYVNKPGTYPMRGDVTILQALSEAGGFTPFASPRKIKLVRNTGGKQETRRFNYYDMIDKGGQGSFLLRAGDTIVVP